MSTPAKHPERESIRPATDRVQMGAVYTPPNLARWVSDLIMQYNTVVNPVVHDPACGDGSLLEACNASFQGCCQLTGCDLSENAVSNVLNSQTIPNAEVRVGDSLAENSEQAKRADIVIMNPPWGAKITDVDRLQRDGFHLVGGRYDSWETFIEWSFLKLRPGTLVAAILPGSLSQGQKHEVKALIDSRSDLLAVADLGEGIFQGVFRTTMVIVYRTEPSLMPPNTAYFRLGHQDRKQVLRNEIPLAQGIRRIHPISRPEKLSRLDDKSTSWAAFCTVSRGVELGANGRVEQCATCGLCRPQVRKHRDCDRCTGSTFIQVKAISPMPLPGYEPIITGRDVTWFHAEPHSWIRTDLEGIKYKTRESYAGPKLLVRKTGLGLNVAIDTTCSFTNQVVFTYRLADNLPRWLLFYFLGVLGSDAMLAFHLAETGDTSWRSHPYVTPASLRHYPVPVPEFGSDCIAAQNVADVAWELNGNSDPLACMNLRERLNLSVSEVFGFSEKDQSWIRTMLSETQEISSFNRAKSKSFIDSRKQG